ncbi:MAG: glutathione S-transferase family protein, partial [Gammaproteobacteria bacterium]|nr:glutathione S-transferase family protein [Gammaproteobacteria bacterium]
GKVPVLEDDELVMFESGAMVQYILDRYGEGRLQPAVGTAEYAIFLQWLWFAEATFARPLGEIVNHRRAFDPELPDVVQEMQDRARLCTSAVDKVLKNREYIAGEFSAADIMMGYTLMLAEMLAPWENCPDIDRYLASLKERGAARKALSDFGL